MPSRFSRRIGFIICIYCVCIISMYIYIYMSYTCLLNNLDYFYLYHFDDHQSHQIIKGRILQSKVILPNLSTSWSLFLAR